MVSMQLVKTDSNNPEVSIEKSVSVCEIHLGVYISPGSPPGVNGVLLKV